jgi:DNA-directed RNA polymerase subunit beta'
LNDDELIPTEINDLAEDDYDEDDYEQGDYEEDEE